MTPKKKAAVEFNNVKLFSFIKKTILILSALCVVGAGSFFANYWQDRSRVSRMSGDIVGHEERLRQLENNQTMITEVLKGINETLEEVSSDIKNGREERKNLNLDIQLIKQRVQAICDDN
jgi:peptidoglycan hydrolase CwlO-like protein